jgi:hypothetical protein
LRSATLDEVQETYDYLISESARALDLGGSFVPFGAGLRADGERTHVNVDLSVESSTPEEHIEGLLTGFRKEAQIGMLVVAGIAFDGRMTEPASDEADALIIQIEHRGGDALQIVIPYRRPQQAAGTVEFLAPTLETIPAAVFVSPTGR